MALGVPGFVRIGAAIAGCALVAACAPEPGPTVTPTPAPPATASPTPLSPTPSATPTETEIERQQRLDWEAAEAAYRAAVKETERLARAGGAQQASPELLAVATGDYLETTFFSLRTINERRWRLVGSISVLGVKHSGGWAPTSLDLIACEENSALKYVDSRGADVTSPDITDYVQKLKVTKRGNIWKVSDVTTKKVAAVSRADCTV